MDKKLFAELMESVDQMAAHAAGEKVEGVREVELWLEQGDESVLRPHEGEMEFTQLPDTLEHLYPEENQRF